ncbi:MAG: universal stress protein [Acidimicrobiia bacterium]|nr:universal stress protein [Acidimicrobiia bacterium]
MTTQAARRIVVGTDGSEHSLSAIRWALQEASLRNVPVDVIHSWHFTPMVDPMGIAIIPPTSEMQAAAKFVLDGVMKKVERDRGGVQVNEIVAQGSPATMLMQAAKDAEMVVVGRRGHGGFVGLLLGSVATQVVHHAPCPVVVVSAKP